MRAMTWVMSGRTNRNRLRLPVVAVLLVSVAAGCSDGDRDGLDASPSASSLESGVATQWMDQLYLLVKENRTSPPRASRQYGYASTTLYESVVHGIPGHRSLAGQLNGLAVLPTPSDTVHHWALVANAALARVVVEFYPADQGAIVSLEAELRSQYAGGLDSEVVERSIRYGDQLAGAILAWARTDGIEEVGSCSESFVPPRDPGLGGWTLASGAPGKGLEPCWGTLRPFVLGAADECPAAGEPSYSSSADSAFYSHALTVYRTTGDAGANLSADESTIARYWADGAGDTGTPPGHWISIVGLVMAAENHKLDVAAESYARVGMALADAFIVCWQTKFESYLLRPITYIRSFIDPTWNPLLVTPGFPSYTSGHSTQSAAAASVLTSFLGPLDFTDTTHTRLNPELGLEPRSFRSFFDASREAAVSRLYGGIHYAFDNQDGADQGLCIGAVHNSKVRFVDG